MQNMNEKFPVIICGINQNPIIHIHFYNKWTKSNAFYYLRTCTFQWRNRDHEKKSPEIIMTIQLSSFAAVDWSYWLEV